MFLYICVHVYLNFMKYFCENYLNGDHYIGNYEDLVEIILIYFIFITKYLYFEVALSKSPHYVFEQLEFCDENV